MTSDADAGHAHPHEIALEAIVPRWAAPPNVRAWSTTRRGGTSAGPWGLVDGRPGGLNLGARCGDDPQAVARNRARVARAVGSMPVWLEQVHGVDVHAIVGTASPAVDASRRPAPDGTGAAAEPRADASVTDVPGVALAVLTADCLPVLFADARGRAVGAAHAGWRGLCAGVLERTVEALRALCADDAEVLAWLGPAIGPQAFEVGDEVRERFCDVDPDAASGFVAGARPGKWLADLHRLARQRLARVGVHRVDGVARCTVRDARDFYSYRRDGRCGRMASMVWMTSR
ncbi:MAG TPA: peptidoglycan editing factor PgeF [Zeimonas sp.]|nr:peptidoglycan editing factor PgeF [Zeimonas sp.]